MPRSVEEWRGKTDDAKVPASVRLRILRRYDGTCYLSGRPIRPGDKWELEHRVPLFLGGAHAESNLAPALVEFHKAKTKAEARIRAKADNAAKKHLRIVDAPPMQGQPFATTRKAADRKVKAAGKLPLPARQRPIYAQEPQA